MKVYKILGCLAALLFACTSVAGQKQNGNTLGPLTNAKAVCGNTDNGISSIVLTMDVDVSQMNCVPADTHQRAYLLSAVFTDAAGHPVYKTEVTLPLKLEPDTLRGLTTFKAAQTKPKLKGMKVAVPEYQVNLPIGDHELHAVVTLKLLGIAPCEARISVGPFTLRKRPVVLCSFRTYGFEMDTTGSGSGAWDFALFNSKEKPPDLEWLIRRGDEQVHKSLSQRNTIYYIGEKSDTTEWFLLTEGDKITLEVRDFDVVSFSDMVGTITFAPSQEREPLPLTGFGNVKSFYYTAKWKPLPIVSFGKLDFRWRNENIWPGGRMLDAQFFIRGFDAGMNPAVWLTRKENGRRVVPAHLRWIEPRLPLQKDGSIPLTFHQGQLKLNLGHYAFSDSLENSGLNFYLQAGVKSGSRFFWSPFIYLPEIQKPAQAYGEHELQAALGTVHEVVVDGIACRRFTWRVSIPGDYAVHLPMGKIVLRPSVKCGNRPVPMAPQIAVPLSNLRNHKPDNEGRIVFEVTENVPLFNFPFRGQVVVADASVELFLQETAAGPLKLAGKGADESTFPIPTPITTCLRLPDLVMSDPRVIDKPLHWSVFLGDYGAFKSDTVKGKIKMNMPGIAEITAMPGDTVSIMIVCDENPYQPYYLGLWEGRIETLTGVPGQTFKLKGEGIRKMKLRVVNPALLHKEENAH